MKVQQKSNISRGMISEKYTSLNILYVTKKKTTTIKIVTTLLTHNAVVSILMENFQKKLNDKEKKSLHQKSTYIEVRKVPLS